jgi:ABC-type branched-subunit amino acid transport system ATPase component
MARAMMSGPSLLLLDEPTSGLDSNEQRVVERMLHDVARSRRVTILIVEHHMDLVRNVANRVIGLQAGQILAVGSPSEVLDSDAFRAAVVGAAHDGQATAPITDSKG